MTDLLDRSRPTRDRRPVTWPPPAPPESTTAVGSMLARVVRFVIGDRRPARRRRVPGDARRYGSAAADRRCLRADARRVARLAVDHRLRLARACAGVALIGTLELAVRHRRRAPRVLLAAVVAGVACRVVALVVQRPAPGAGSLTGAVSVDRSFPSLPAAIAAAVAITLVRELPFGDRRRQTRCGRRRRRARRRPSRERLVVAARRGGRVHPRRWSLPASSARRCADGVPRLGAPDHHPTRVAVRMERRGGRGRRRRCRSGSAIPATSPLPGNATVAERSVEYLRDRGLGSFVDRGEAWWLWSHLPPSSGQLTALPDAPLARDRRVGCARRPAAGHHTGARRARVDGPSSPAIARVVAQIATTVLRPDPNHPTLVAAVAWISQTTTRLQLIAGTREPGGGPGPAGATVPARNDPTCSPRSTPATG